MTPHARATAGTSLDGREMLLTDVLGQMSQELEYLSLVAEDVQDLTAALTAQGSLTADETRRLQQLDLLTQTLGDLTKVTRHLTEKVQDGVIDRHDLGLSIILADLRARLTGKGLRESRDDAGNVALF